MNVAVLVQARVPTLVMRVAPAQVERNRLPLAWPRGRHAPPGNPAVRETLALVKARGANQAKRRSFRQLARQLAVVGKRLQETGLLDAMNALVRHERSRPLRVIFGIVL